MNIVKFRLKIFRKTSRIRIYAQTCNFGLAWGQKHLPKVFLKSEWMINILKNSLKIKKPLKNDLFWCFWVNHLIQRKKMHKIGYLNFLNWSPVMVYIATINNWQITMMLYHLNFWYDRINSFSSIMILQLLSFFNSVW